MRALAVLMTFALALHACDARTERKAAEAGQKAQRSAGVFLRAVSQAAERALHAADAQADRLGKGVDALGRKLDLGGAAPAGPEATPRLP